MWQAEQLTTLGNWTRRNYRQYAPEFTRINQAAISLLQSSAERAQLVEEDLLLRTGIQRAGGFFVAPEGKLQSLLNAVRHDLSQAEHSILRQADDVYRRTLFDAQMYLQTGSGTLDNAIDMAVQDFMQRGIRSVVYRNGHRVEASTYARMALRTANVRAVMTGEGAARDRFGVHTVIVSPSGIACEKCAPWMGQILVDDVYCSGSREEAAELGVPRLSEAVSSGLLHPQCNCAVHTFQPGISKLPEVTDADREQAVNRYRLTQQQRYNERQIRKWKYAEDAAPDPAAQQAAHAKVRAWQQTNKALCDAHPAELRRDYQREKIWDAPKNPVVPDVIEKSPDKPLTAGAERGIMIQRGEQRLEQAKKRDHKIMITDTAIEKIQRSSSAVFTAEQNTVIDRKHRELLTIAKEQNDSNEVALLFSLVSGEQTVTFGSESAVNIFANPASSALMRRISGLFLAHNHPSTQNFSYSDLGVFLMNDNIQGMSVVTNLGAVHMIVKTAKYDFVAVYETLKQIRQQYGAIDGETDAAIVREFLKGAGKLGIEYL